MLSNKREREKKRDRERDREVVREREMAKGGIMNFLNYIS